MILRGKQVYRKFWSIMRCQWGSEMFIAAEVSTIKAVRRNVFAGSMLLKNRLLWQIIKYKKLSAHIIRLICGVETLVEHSLSFFFFLFRKKICPYAWIVTLFDNCLLVMIQAKNQRLLKDLIEPVRAPDTCESA